MKQAVGLACCVLALTIGPARASTTMSHSYVGGTGTALVAGGTCDPFVVSTVTLSINGAGGACFKIEGAPTTAAISVSDAAFGLNIGFEYWIIDDSGHGVGGGTQCMNSTVNVPAGSWEIYVNPGSNSQYCPAYGSVATTGTITITLT